MNDNNINDFYNSVNGDNFNGSNNQTQGNMYDLTQPPAELNNTPSMFEYQNNVSAEVAVADASLPANDFGIQEQNYQQDFNSITVQPVDGMEQSFYTPNLDTNNNYTVNEFNYSTAQDDSFSSFGREDYISNYNKSSYDLSNDNSFNSSFESQLANSQDISFYNNQGTNIQQQQMYNPSMMQPTYNQSYQDQTFNPSMMQPNFNQSYQEPMYNPGMMQPQQTYTQSAPSPADNITTIQRKKEEEPVVVRQEGLGKIEYRSSGGTFTKIFLILFYVIVIGSIAFFGYKLYLSKQKFYFNKSKLVMMVDSTFTPKVYVKGELDENSNYSWSPTDETVISVSNTGEVKALKKGRAKIDVVNRKTGNFEVIIVEVIDVEVKQLEITEDEKSIKINDTYTLVPMINGRADVIGKYHWSSNDDSIATVDENGIVTGVGEGRTKITLTLEGCELTSEISIVVTN